MIVDVLENAERYVALHRGFAKAFEFLSRPDLAELQAGSHEIDGESCYAMVAIETGRKKEDAQLETHDKYIDIQMIIEGTDTMGWRSRASCRKPSCPYDPETDLQFFADEPYGWVAVKSGMFALFFPEDAHLPLVSPGQIHKVVVKIAVE